MHRRFKLQKIPARKRKLCFKLMSPHIKHDTEKIAEKEKDKLAAKFKGSKFDTFQCPHCKKWHVGKLEESDETESQGE